MGLVFMAEQQRPMRRLVALKIIKPGMDTRQVIARFEAERQALALMDHPNIARVFDAGTTAGGRPYFVMELVKGTPITDFCDQHHLTPRQRLELFVPVCQAVQHAHQKGIIHRDLKPSNVMFSRHDTTPVVKVIDFGVAKALGQELTEKTLFTGLAQMIGTPLYMSPEQAGMSDLDVDTRSDIYTLGVLLYELLTGTTPFDKERFKKAAYDEIRRIIRHEEPPKPSTRLTASKDSLAAISAQRQTDPAKLTKLVRGELDWIVMKALEKDRNRRYETASALAADVERYLKDEAVQACPPSPGYRLRKFFRRYKSAVLAASMVVLVLVGGIIGTTMGLIRATNAEAEAVSEAKQKAEALTDKEAALEAAQNGLFLALVNRARAERGSGRPGQRFAALKAIRQAAQIRVTPELRTEAIAALVLPDAEVAQEWERSTEDNFGVVSDGSFSRYAGIDRQGRVTVCRLKNGQEEVMTRLPPHGQSAFRGIALSLDGGFLACGYGPTSDRPAGGARVWKLEGPEPRILLDATPGLNNDLTFAFHPTDPQLAIGHADKTVSIYDLATGTRLQRLAVSTPPEPSGLSARRAPVSGGLRQCRAPFRY
jgi:hypothetical protein